MKTIHKIGFGGGCHWCTEAVFQALIGVNSVKQGWIASTKENTEFSEAVIIEYNTTIIPLEVLIEIHLLTHKSTSKHSMRKKYRSAIYTFNEMENASINLILKKLQSNFKTKLITQVLPFKTFKPSREAITNYYTKNPEKPFCKTYINPKLKILINQFSEFTKTETISQLTP